MTTDFDYLSDDPEKKAVFNRFIYSFQHTTHIGATNATNAIWSKARAGVVTTQGYFFQSQFEKLYDASIYELSPIAQSIEFSAYWSQFGFDYSKYYFIPNFSPDVKKFGDTDDEENFKHRTEVKAAAHFVYYVREFYIYQVVWEGDITDSGENLISFTKNLWNESKREPANADEWFVSGKKFEYSRELDNLYQATVFLHYIDCGRFSHINYNIIACFYAVPMLHYDALFHNFQFLGRESALRAMFEMYAILWEVHDATIMYMRGTAPSPPLKKDKQILRDTLPENFFRELNNFSYKCDPNKWECFRRVDSYFRELPKSDYTRRIDKLAKNWNFNISWYNGRITEAHRW